MQIIWLLYDYFGAGQLGTNKQPLTTLFSFRSSHLIDADLSVYATGYNQEVIVHAHAFKATSHFLFYQVKVTGIMLRSFIHLDLNFVQGNRYGSVCIL